MPSEAPADLRLDGKAGIVTGALGGLGRAISARLAALGASLLLIDRQVAEGHAFATSLGPHVFFEGADVASEADWAQTARRANAEFGRLDFLVNNAAIYRPARILDETAEGYRRIFEVNQLGPLLGMKAVQPLLKRSGGGSIINISSTGGLRAYEGTIAYASTKWALRGMSKVAARELAGDGIRVNSVHPGLCETPMAYENTPELLDSLRKGIPAGRLGEPAEVASLVGFLASDASRYMSGAELAIDGAATT